ncbi:uncharacterized protein LOC125211365 isoform X2 [Salvia hispanica]|uniref:uncharacterized protein LOC125211365 isoform X2 n=1 Tax=Salvia hispanica TaxID=49212 RepID=UPI0020090140|nr:uncharacterized protein LOC125211365 isoform X2 [Salvia hispanica]
MATRRHLIVLALIVLFISFEVSSILAQNSGNASGNGNGGGKNGNANGNENAGGNNGNANGNGNGGGKNGNANGNGNDGGKNGNANGNGNGGGKNGNANGNGNDGGNNGNANGNGNGGGKNGNANGNGNSGGSNGNANGNGNGGGRNGNGNGNGNAGGNNGNGNGNGNSGGNNGNGNGNGNSGGNNGNGNGNGNGNSDSNASNGVKRKRPPYDAASTNYIVVTPLPNTGQERSFCQARGKCLYKTLTCPAECPQRKPKKNKKNKGCFVDCSSKCEATCKWRRPKCNGYGSLCYDPRFVGGDGVMFYFHGSKGSDYAIVSDENLHINAHLIGTRPQGRTRDYTWVQALSVMFDSHTLVIAARKLSHWSDNVDAILFKWNGHPISIPRDGEAEWRVDTGERDVTVERTDDVNTVRVSVTGLVELDIRVVPIGKEENRVHNYQLPNEDAYAHLETQFKLLDLSEGVEGILGKTYRPGYVSPAKRGVPMPMVGGEDDYFTPSLYSPSCKVCIFQRPSSDAVAVA